MANPQGTYYAMAHTLTVSDQGDFFQMRNTTGNRIEVLEIRVWQTSDTALAMNAIRIQRGVGGSGGNAVTERSWDAGGKSVAATCFDTCTGDVGTLDLDIHCGWNILQEFVWLPTPEFYLILQPSDHVGLSLLISDSLTMGASMLWQEFGA